MWVTPDKLALQDFGQGNGRPGLQVPFQVLSVLRLRGQLAELRENLIWHIQVAQALGFEQGGRELDMFPMIKEQSCRELP